jgi:hypothetical protein
MVRKSYWYHQYEEEEIFLTKMRQKGWKFISLHKGLPTTYVFEKCELDDYIYQIDYVKKEEDTSDYHQLYQDAGWEEIISLPAIGVKRYYFCKKSSGNVERIYTDIDSKITLFEKLWRVYGCILLSYLCLGINGIYALTSILSRGTGGVWIIIAIIGIVIFLLLAIMILYFLIGLLRKKRKLQEQKKRGL